MFPENVTSDSGIKITLTLLDYLTSEDISIVKGVAAKRCVAPLRILIDSDKIGIFKVVDHTSGNTCKFFRNGVSPNTEKGVVFNRRTQYAIDS